MINIQKEKFILNNINTVCIATFSHYKKGKRLPVNGFVGSLLSFFLSRVNKITLVDGSHPVSDTADTVIEEYNHGKRTRKFVLPHTFYLPIYWISKIPSKSYTRISYKLRDFASIFYLILVKGKRYDLFIGVEAVYAIAGVLLKKLGMIGVVIYYVSDYSPRRFGGSVFNTIYLWLDRFCVKNADFTWDVSPAMLEARLGAGLQKKYAKKVIHVPNALFPEQISSAPIAKRQKNQLVYMGILDKDMGPDLAIEALAKVKKKIPDVLLHIIGGTTDNVIKLKALSQNLGLEKTVIFHGFVSDNRKMAHIVKNSMIGLAPYRSFKTSVRWWGDAGKIRQYLASGLPVVTTKVPPLGKEITTQGAGILVNDRKEDFANGIIRLLTDKELYRTMSKKAGELSKENTWENSYMSAFKKMDEILKMSN